jgi:copper resistance protein C
MMNKTLCLAMVVVAMAGAVVLAHSAVQSSSPADGASIKVMPKQISLRFDEAIEPRFSTFKVYSLGKVLSKAGAAAAADALLKQAISKKNDAETRADLGFIAKDSKNVVINLKDRLKPASYAVIWQITGADTHVVRNFITFTYQK